MIYIPSKKQWDDSRPDFPVLGDNVYWVQVVKVEPQEKQKYQSNEMEEVMTVTFEVLNTNQGGPVKDVEGNVVTERKLFLDIRKFEDKETGEEAWAFGFNKGEPSIPRQLICYALGKDPFGEAEFDSFEQLLGKKIQAFVVRKQSEKTGKYYNKIDRFLPNEQNEEIPIIEE